MRIEDDDLVLALVSPEADGRSLKNWKAYGRRADDIYNVVSVPWISLVL